MTTDRSVPQPSTDPLPGSAFALNIADLGMHECRAMLAEESVGRVAWTSLEGPVILPVSYVLRGDRIAFRTSPYGTLAQLVTPTLVAFQIEELDRPHRVGRSVLVQGVAQAAQSSAWEPNWRIDDVTPWAGGVRNLFIEIGIQHLTGRAFHPRQ